MHRLSSTLLGLAALCGAATTAFAGAGDITTTVTPLQTNVTYSTPTLATYVGYTVTIANAGGNTINHIRFTASASVTDPAELATYDSAEGATCVTTNATNTAIECWIGQLPAVASYPTFAVFFKAPAKVVNGVADDVSPGFLKDFVNLSGNMVYAEGPNGSNPAVNSDVPWGSAAPVLLGTASDTNVKSGVPRLGGTFFTGNGGVSFGTDKFATRVTVPRADAYSKAAINESVVACANANFVECWESEIKIEGNNASNTYSPYLTIILREDASNITMRPVRIENVEISYVDNNDVAHGFIGDCASATTPRTDGLPCIAKRTYYKNRQVDGWTLDLDGDFEWTIISLKNGRFGIQ